MVNALWNISFPVYKLKWTVYNKINLKRVVISWCTGNLITFVCIDYANFCIILVNISKHKYEIELLKTIWNMKLFIVNTCTF